MQTIGVSPPAHAAAILRFTDASVSPNNVRRSEWPMMTYSAPVSAIIGALISPVNAPSRSQWRSCAAMQTLLLRAASAAACSAVNGGASTISTSSMSLTRLRNSLTYLTVSATVLNIFQLPAIKGVLISLLRERSDTGKCPAAQEFQRGAAAGGDVRDAILDARLLHRCNRITSADDRRPLHVRHRVR